MAAVGGHESGGEKLVSHLFWALAPSPSSGSKDSGPHRGPSCLEPTFGCRFIPHACHERVTCGRLGARVDVMACRTDVQCALLELLPSQSGEDKQAVVTHAVSVCLAALRPLSGTGREGAVESRAGTLDAC